MDTPNINPSQKRKLQLSRLDVIFFIVLCFFALFALIEFFDGTSLHFINNSLCYEFLGCNAGFFGFDAVSHLFGGIFWTVFTVWLVQQYPRLRFFPHGFIKSVVMLVGVVSILHICWEIYEFSLDYIDFRVLQNPYDPTQLAQPGNADTVGDMSFGSLGVLLGVTILRIFDSSVFQRLMNSKEEK